MVLFPLLVQVPRLPALVPLPLPKFRRHQVLPQSRQPQAAVERLKFSAKLWGLSICTLSANLFFSSPLRCCEVRGSADTWRVNKFNQEKPCLSTLLTALPLNSHRNWSSLLHNRWYCLLLIASCSEHQMVILPFPPDAPRHGGDDATSNPSQPSPPAVSTSWCNTSQNLDMLVELTIKPRISQNLDMLVELTIKPRIWRCHPLPRIWWGSSLTRWWGCTPNPHFDVPFYSSYPHQPYLKYTLQQHCLFCPMVAHLPSAKSILPYFSSLRGVAILYLNLEGLLSLTFKSWLRCSNISPFQTCSISENQICISVKSSFSDF